MINTMHPETCNTYVDRIANVGPGYPKESCRNRLDRKESVERGPIVGGKYYLPFAGGETLSITQTRRVLINVTMLSGWNSDVPGALAT